jgi:hypothetical protein
MKLDQESFPQPNFELKTKIYTKTKRFKLKNNNYR